MSLLSCQNRKETKVLGPEIFFKDPEKAQFQISPDGEHISFLKPAAGKLNLFVQNLSNNKITQVTKSRDQSIRYYLWVNNTTLFYVKDRDSSEIYKTYLSKIYSNELIDISPQPKVRLEVIDEIKNEDNYVLVASNERKLNYFDIYKLDVTTGKKELFIQNPGNITSWIADGNGQIRMAIGSDQVNETLYFRDSNSNGFKPVNTNNFKSTLQPLFATGNKGHIYALSNLNRDKLALVDYDCNAAKEVKVIFENPDNDISEIFYSKSRKIVNYLAYEDQKRKMVFFDGETKAMFLDLQNKLPQQQIKIIDTDYAEKNFIVKTYTDKDPGAYYLYQLKSKSLKKLTDLNNDIKPEEMAEMKLVSYQSRDGLKIQGYLTIPVGKEPKNLPCIILPHFGPSTRNTWGYQPEVQYFANRGYAVFQMNFRGSTGYGKTFLSAGFKQWGKGIMNDITDGTKWLINQKIANPNKIAIYGYRFGGFAALNQLIYNPNLYQCAASYAGYINLFTHLKGLPAYYKPYEQMLDEIIGSPNKDIDYLKLSSPIFQAEKIKKPVYIAIGAKDPSINLNEMNQFVKEIQQLKVEVNYRVYDGEYYVFRNEQNRIQMYRELSDFFDANLKSKN